MKIPLFACNVWLIYSPRLEGLMCRPQPKEIKSMPCFLMQVLKKTRGKEMLSD